MMIWILLVTFFFGGGVLGYKIFFSKSGQELLPIGSPAPDFNLQATGNRQISLASLKGKHVVLVFYPMDNTPGCTVQLCALRDELDEFNAANTQVLGVNPGTLKSHEAFAQKQGYSFPLLVDTDRQLAKAFGVSEILGFNDRTVFILDKSGVVRFVSQEMPSNERLLEAIESFESSESKAVVEGVGRP